MDRRLCSASYKFMIQTWNKDSGVCELSIEAGRIDTSIVQLRDGRICSGDLVGNMEYIYRVCELTLSGHTNTICVIVVIDELVTCSCSREQYMYRM
jgi:hypothetical protein